MIDKKILNGILAIFSVLILLVPIGLSDYIQGETIDNIIAVQGNYTDGFECGLYSGNITNTTDDIDQFDTTIGFETNADTIFNGRKVGSPIFGTYYGNYISYVGNGTFTVIPDWDDMPESTWSINRYFFIPLNITTGDFANFDFIRISTNYDDSYVGEFESIYYAFESDTSLHGMGYFAIDNQTNLIVPSYAEKQSFLANPNGTIFVGIAIYEEKTQTSFNLKVSAVKLDDSDKLFSGQYTDFTIWLVMVMGLDVFYLFVAVFSNPWIDVKWDKKDKQKWRR